MLPVARRGAPGAKTVRGGLFRPREDSRKISHLGGAGNVGGCASWGDGPLLLLLLLLWWICCRPGPRRSVDIAASAAATWRCYAEIEVSKLSDEGCGPLQSRAGWSGVGKRIASTRGGAGAGTGRNARRADGGGGRADDGISGHQGGKGGAAVEGGEVREAGDIGHGVGSGGRVLYATEASLRGVVWRRPGGLWWVPEGGEGSRDCTHGV